MAVSMTRSSSARLRRSVAVSGVIAPLSSERVQPPTKWVAN